MLSHPSSSAVPFEAPPPYEDFREQSTSLVEKNGKVNANQQDEHDLERGAHSQSSVMFDKQGELQSHAHLTETGRVPALQRSAHRASDQKLESLEKSWLYHRQELGSTDDRTLTCLFDLCRYWKNLGALNDAIMTEVPQILSWAIKARNTEFLNFLLQQRVDVNQPDEEGETPLFHASSRGHASIVKQLLDAGADIHCTAGSNTPLHASATENHKLVVDYLLEAGADVNALNPKGNCALYLASNNGNLEVVRKLLAKGAQVDHAAPSAIFPLHAAAARGHVEIVEMLLDAGADLTARNFDMTPVLVAISYQHERVLDRLLARGAAANPIMSEDYALHFATRKGSRKIVTILLDAGAEINTTNAKGITALHIAASLGNEDLVDRLLARSAFVNSKSVSGWTALHDASFAGHVVVVKQLLYAGADLTSTTDTGFTPLHCAAEKGFLDIVNLFLDRNAGRELSDPDGCLLDMAVKGRNEEVVRRFVDAGVNVNAQSPKKWTALLRACREKDLAIVELLLEHGAKPDLADYHGLTPLIHASNVGDLSIVRKLVCECSVNVNSQSIDGLTALHMAAQDGHASVVDFLLSRGADANALFLGNTTPLSMATWDLQIDVITHLAPVTENACLLDCYGWNSIDRATADPSALSKFPIKTRTENYVPTSAATRNSHVRQLISNLARSMLHSRLPNDMRLGVLADCLLIMHDTTDADHAYQLDVRDYAVTVEGPLPYMGKCDLCDASITGNLYICLTCAGRALCEDCMKAYEEKTKELRNCKDHKFHGVSSHRYWEGDYGTWPMRLVNTRGQSVDQWLKHILAGYGG